jgi:hypothetical protein
MMKDDSLEDELPKDIPVLSSSGWEPYALYRLFTGKTKAQAATPHLGEENQSGLREQFVLNLVGKTEAAALEAISAAGLSPYLRETGWVTHRQALAEMVASDLLWCL